MICIGFTGTRIGMIRPQLYRVREILQPQMAEFHHGDCLGADMQAHNIMRSFISDSPAIIHVHPPTIPKNRAFCKGDVMHPEKDYLTRNIDIVDAADLIVAAPKMMSEEQRSGTWHAIRYATSIKTRVVIVWPNGKTEER